MTALAQTAFSHDDFLAWEAEQTEKHEYLAGEVFAMVGATDAHVTISGNLFSLLRNHLRGTPCRVFIADMQLQVEQANAFFYPDVFVTCAPRDAELTHFKREPVLVVEVLSPSTASYDRGLKFATYRQLPSLQEYVLIDTERMAVDVFRRDKTDHWVLYPFEPDQSVELESIRIKAPIATLYEDVVLECTTDSADAPVP